MPTVVAPMVPRRQSSGLADPHDCLGDEALIRMCPAPHPSGRSDSPKGRHDDRRWGSRCSLSQVTLTVAPDDARGTWIQVWRFECRRSRAIVLRLLSLSEEFRDRPDSEGQPTTSEPCVIGSMRQAASASRWTASTVTRSDFDPLHRAGVLRSVRPDRPRTGRASPKDSGTERSIRYRYGPSGDVSG
jgi:hypothetical protein